MEYYAAVKKNKAAGRCPGYIVKSLELHNVYLDTICKTKTT